MIEAARAEVAATAARMVAAGLVTGTAGNVSRRVGDPGNDLVAITPSGLDYDRLRPGEVGLHDLAGGAVDAPMAPSSELPLHLAVYEATEAAAIVHTHSPAATAVSLLVSELPAVHYYVAMFGGPVRVVPYARFGTAELAAATAAALRSSAGVLLANHGAVTIGPDLTSALNLAITLEWCCEVYLRAAAAGTPTLLSGAELDEARVALAAYRAARP